MREERFQKCLLAKEDEEGGEKEMGESRRRKLKGDKPKGKNYRDFNPSKKEKWLVVHPFPDKETGKRYP